MGFSKQEYWSGVPLPSPIWPLVSLYWFRRPRTLISNTWTGLVWLDSGIWLRHSSHHPSLSDWSWHLLQPQCRRGEGLHSNWADRGCVSIVKRLMGVLVYVVMEAEKSQDITPASWRPRRAGGYGWRLENLRTDGKDSCSGLKAWGPGRLKAPVQKRSFLPLADSLQALHELKDIHLPWRGPPALLTASVLFYL